MSAGKIYPAVLLNQLPIPCPSCQRHVDGFVGDEEVDEAPRTIGGHRAATSSVPAHLLRGQLNYILHPCYCRVDQYWMSAMAAEIARRQKGLPAQPVVGMSEANRETRTTALLQRIQALYSERDAAVRSGQISRQSAVERDLLTLVNELMSMTPGAHNRLPAIRLTDATRTWAENNRMVVPGEDEPVAEDTSSERSYVPVTAQVLQQLHEGMRSSYPNESAAATTARLERIMNNLAGFADGNDVLSAETATFIRMCHSHNFQSVLPRIFRNANLDELEGAALSNGISSVNGQVVIDETERMAFVQFEKATIEELRAIGVSKHTTKFRRELSEHLSRFIVRQPRRVRRNIVNEANKVHDDQDDAV